MFHMVRRITTITILTIGSITPQYIFSTISFPRLNSWFNRTPHEATLSHTYIAPEDGTLSIETTAGNITIQTDAKQEHIKLTAVKKTAQEEQLVDLTIAEEQSSRRLQLRSLFDIDKYKHATIDYTLVVPEQLKLHVTTHRGSITINKTMVPTTCYATQGAITIDSCCKAAHLHTHHGSIQITQALNDIFADVDHGDICIDHAHKNVQARTKKGNISVTYAYIPPTSAVNLHTDVGSITLALPASANASIKGTTQHGTVTSEHYLTLKEQLTKLDAKAWRRFKKEVHGMLGTGEALVNLTSKSGNVKINQTKQSA